MSKSRVTIHDVARHANVSPSTVSLVVHDRDNVSDGQKHRVRQVMRQLGYQPRRPNRKRGGVSPATARSHVAVIHSQREYRDGELFELMRGYLRGINQALEGMVRQVTVVAAGEDASKDPMLSEFAADGDMRVDGAVVVGVRPEEGHLALMVDCDIPLVGISLRARHGEFSSVCTDDFGAGRQAIDHLVGLGHRRIAVVTFDIDAYDYARERWIGCCRALGRHGLEPVFHEDTQQSDWPDSYIQRLCGEILASGATALFCSDLLAVRCIDELDRLGLTVPGDFSIVGLDCLDISSRSGLAPTSIGFDCEKVGRLAAVRLLDILASRHEGIVHHSVRVATGLVERDTTAPCNGSRRAPVEAPAD